LVPARFDRTAILIGESGLKILDRSKVAVFGLGGVGSYVVEGLARAGLGELHLFDFDQVDITNINRQLHALSGTVGRAKAELMAERVAEINPRARVSAGRDRYAPGAWEAFLPAGLDYLVDAVDDVGAKVDLIVEARKRGVPVISSMGAGNKLDPTAFRVDDISRTSICPLARSVRRKLRQAGITKGVQVVYSTEIPVQLKIEEAGSGGQSPRPAPGSISFVPSVAGLIIAGTVVKSLLDKGKTDEKR